MARPAAKELTERELEVMHVFWKHSAMTADEARSRLATNRAYATVANLVRILLEKDYLEQTNTSRPFQYKPVRSFEEVSQSLVGDLLKRVFHRSREQLLVNVLRQRKLTSKERAVLEEILKEQDR